ncbi:MAG: hypothetical protein Q4C70_14035, partial [Planctomycetia bacterium]|nr:hypothetical protein [Planctomycetia bacterium]
MRDLDRFDKRNVIHRIDRNDPEPEYKGSFGSTMVRLIVLILILIFFGWGMWELSQPANIWIREHEIQRTESDVRLIHEDAERARRQLAAPKEVTVESLIYKCMNDDYQLSEDERAFVKNGWERFISGSKITDTESLLFRIRMCYDENGNIVDIPVDEWETRKKEYEEMRHKQMLRNDPKVDIARTIVEEHARNFVEKENTIEGAAAKAADKEKRARYDRRSNRELVSDLVLEFNESFYKGESPYAAAHAEEDAEMEKAEDAKEAEVKTETEAENAKAETEEAMKAKTEE